MAKVLFIIPILPSFTFIFNIEIKQKQNGKSLPKVWPKNVKHVGLKDCLKVEHEKAYGK